MTDPKEWHEDETNVALDDVGEAEENTADELVGEEIKVDDWGGAL